MRRRRGRLAVAALLLLAWAAARAESPRIPLLTIDGVINPLSAAYLERGLRAAADAGAPAVVVRLDTPGGLERSMRRMAAGILGSRVPVIVYVAPAGARAASAGMFVTIAAHVAAMAPGTNIGAAHPVGLGGGEQDAELSRKAVNDAAALARAIAAQRARNAAWAEAAVRESVSITAAEALEKGVVDLVVPDLQTLLLRVDGRTVTTSAGPVVLRTAGVPVVPRPMSLPERILMTIVDPNVAYLLFTIGSIGIIAELYNPGSLFPGITGAICLVLAFVAFGSLPLNWGGLFLLLLGIGLLAAELTTEGTGFLAAGGLAAFVLGSLLLYTPVSPVLPAVRVSPWLILVVSGAVGVFFIFVLAAIVRAGRVPVATGAQALAGRPGLALTDLAPSGRVRVDSEVWTAISEAGPIAAGDPVAVVGVDGVILRVRPL